MEAATQTTTTTNSVTELPLVTVAYLYILNQEALFLHAGAQ